VRRGAGCVCAVRSRRRRPGRSASWRALAAGGRSHCTVGAVAADTSGSGRRLLVRSRGGRADRGRTHAFTDRSPVAVGAEVRLSLSRAGFDGPNLAAAAAQPRRGRVAALTDRPLVGVGVCGTVVAAADAVPFGARCAGLTEDRAVPADSWGCALPAAGAFPPEQRAVVAIAPPADRPFVDPSDNVAVSSA